MSNYVHQGINFHYEVEGAGYPLMFFHGLGGDWTQCKTILEHVHGFRKVLMDVRGHGTTFPLGSNQNLNFDQFAKDAISLATHLGFEEIIAGGISMGSAIAIRMALMSTRWITALILIRPAWLNKPTPENLREHVRIGELLQEHSIERAKLIFSRSEEYTVVKEAAPAVANSLLGQFDAPKAKEYAVRLIEIPASVPFDDDKDLAQIRTETLILGTDQDPVHPRWVAEDLAAKIPMARYTNVTSKSEDIDKHFGEVSYHILEFLEKFRRPAQETTTP